MNSVELYNQLSFLSSKSITHGYSTSFSTAIKLLHPDLRAPIHGIYGMVRLADEIVDTFHEYDKRNLLEEFRKETLMSIERRISLNPILNSFQLVVNQYNIELSLVEAFFDSMYEDLEKKTWETVEEMNEYIYGSAEVVGLMCLQVFCEGNNEMVKDLQPAARALGAAFQKVNFLRDLNDDITHLQRKYFPFADLNNLTCSVKKQIEEDIHHDFQAAFEGIRKLPIKSRFGVMVAYKYYLCLFNKIKSLPPQVLMKKRISIPNIQKAYLLVKAGFERPFYYG